MSSIFQEACLAIQLVVSGKNNRACEATDTVSLTEKDVRHVARLSAIRIEDHEIPQLKQDLGDILEYVNRLSAEKLHSMRHRFISDRWP